MKITITRAYTVQAAHQLNGLREGHKCARLHGHNYAIEVSVTGPVTNGFVVDAEDIDRLVGSELLARLDHRNLNETIEQPTAENIAAWVLTLATERLPGTCRVVVRENARLWAEATNQ